MAFGLLIGGLIAHQRAMHQKQLEAQQQKNIDQAHQDALAQLAWQHAYETRNQADTEATGGLTYDPATGTSKVAPLAQPPTSVTAPATPSKTSQGPLHDKYNQLLAQAAWYAQQPQPAAQAYAKFLMTQATQVGDQIRAWETQNSAMQRAKYTQGAEDSRTRYVQGQENTRETRRESNENTLHGAPTWKDLHPTASGGKDVADPDTISGAEALIRKSPDPETTAANIKARIISAGGTAKTVEAVDALGRYYAGKKGQVGATKPKYDPFAQFMPKPTPKPNI